MIGGPIFVLPAEFLPSATSVAGIPFTRARGVGTRALDGRLPRRAPEAWRASAFRPSPVRLSFVGWGLVVISTACFALAAAQCPGSLRTFAGVVASGAVLYRVMLAQRSERC